MTAPFEIQDLGVISWREALELQMARVEAVSRGTAPPAVYLLEHEPVITLGRKGNVDSLLVDKKTLAARGVALEHASRGGDVTCHFPGQLVVYVIMPVDKRPGGLKKVFHDLEEAVIKTLDNFGIPAHHAQGRPGVWTGRGKIASIGLGLRRWVTFHGLALNVARDLELFSLVTPCGLHGVQMTSMERERLAVGLASWEVEMHEVKNVFVQEFFRHVAAAPVAARAPAPGA